MKYNKIKTSAALLLIIVVVAQLFSSCKKDDNSGGVPEIQYIRMNDPAKADSLLVSASLGQVITLVGKNLGEVREIKFNDQEALLNTSYITDAAIIVTVPTGIPEVVTDSMTLVTLSGIRVQYPFKVQVSPPLATSMKSEYVPDGGTAVINGNYFIDDPNKPLKAIFPGNLEAEILDIQLKQLTVVVPDGAGAGKIAIQSIYGKAYSNFTFRDDNNLVVDFDTYTNPWGLGAISSSDGCSGNYLHFVGETGAWNWANHLMFGYWSASLNPIATGSNGSLGLRFEVNVGEWSDTPMLIWFATEGDGISPDENYAQAHWKPWLVDGGKSTYSTNGWITYTIPLTDFIYNKEETQSNLEIDNISKYSNVNFMLFGAADDTYPIDIKIDNVRVVPL